MSPGCSFYFRLYLHRTVNLEIHQSHSFSESRLASEYGLTLLYKEEFHQVFQEHQEHPEFKPLLVRMKVVDNEGASAMDEDQWEAASEYLNFFLLESRSTETTRYLYCFCFREAMMLYDFTLFPSSTLGSKYSGT